MKGISLPINVVVVIAIVVLVLVVIGYFFVTSTGTGISRTDAERAFSEGCSSMCDDPCPNLNFISHVDARPPGVDIYAKFAKACVSLGYATAPESNTDAGVNDAKACLAACGSCIVECEQRDWPGA